MGKDHFQIVETKDYGGKEGSHRFIQKFPKNPIMIMKMCIETKDNITLMTLKKGTAIKVKCTSYQQTYFLKIQQ